MRHENWIKVHNVWISLLNTNWRYACQIWWTQMSQLNMCSGWDSIPPWTSFFLIFYFLQISIFWRIISIYVCHRNVKRILLRKFKMTPLQSHSNKNWQEDKKHETVVVHLTTAQEMVPLNEDCQIRSVRKDLRTYLFSRSFKTSTGSMPFDWATGVSRFCFCCIVIIT